MSWPADLAVAAAVAKLDPSKEINRTRSSYLLIMFRNLCISNFLSVDFLVPIQFSKAPNMSNECFMKTEKVGNGIQRKLCFF